MLSKILAAITRAQAGFVDEQNRYAAFESLLSDLLELTESEYGFIGEVLFRPDGQPYLQSCAMSEMAWADSTLPAYDRQAMKGMTFSNMKTLFGAAMLSGQVVIANDPANDPRSGGLPPGHPPLNCFLGVPIFYGSTMVALLGLANRQQGYTPEMVDVLEPLSTTIAQLVASQRYQQVQQAQQAQLIRKEAAVRSLNEIASLPSDSAQVQLQSALRLASQYLDLPFGIISRIQGEQYSIVAQTCPGSELQDGMVFPLGDTYCSLALASNEVLHIDHMAQSPHARHPCYQKFGLESYIGCPVWVDGERYGTLNFSSPQPRAQRFDGSDDDFVLLLARWIGVTLQRQAREVALAKSSHLLQDLFAHISQGFVMQRADGCVIEANPAACELLGLSKAQLLARKSLDPSQNAIHEDGRPYPVHTHPAMLAISSGQTIRDAVMGVFHPQKQAYRWLNIDAYPRCRGSEQDDDVVYSVFSDITEQKEAQLQRDYERGLLSDIINTQPAGVFRFRVQPINEWQEQDWLHPERVPIRFELVNQLFCEIFETSEADFLANPGLLLTLIHPDDLMSFAASNEAANFNLTPLHWEGRLCLNQREKWVRFESIARKFDNQEVCWTGLVQDITERRMLNMAMQRLSLVASHTSNGVIITDASGAIEWANTALQMMTGYSLNELAGQRPGALFQGPDTDAATVQYMAQCLMRRQPFDVELINYHRNGTPYWVSIQCNPIFDGLNFLQGFIAIESDITAKKRVELELRQARQNAEAASKAKSMFVANMSHEIRTPLNGVLGMAQLLLDTPLNDAQRKYIETIQASGDALLSVINDILDFSKIEAGKLDLDPIEFDLHSMIDDFADMMAIKPQQNGVEFLCRIDENVPQRVVGDPGRIRQILINLTGNAIKFTEQGEVDVHIGLQEQAGKEITLRFTVRDTGIGIAPEQLACLFQSFSQVDAGITRRFGGSGLGLAISKQLANLMGGHIGVESHLDQGSEFWFTARLQLGEGVYPLAVRSADLSGQRVLIAERHRNNGELLRELLQRKGMLPDVVVSAEQVLDALAVAQQAGQPYAMLLLDFQLPGEDSEQLARRIKETPAFESLPIVMLTAVGQRGDAGRAQAAGCNGFLNKPIHQRDLYEMLQLVIRNGHSNQLVTRHTVREIRQCQLSVLLAEDNPINQLVAVKMLEAIGCRVDTAQHGAEAIARLQQASYDLVFMDMQMPVMDGLTAARLIRTQSRFDTMPIIALTANAMQADRDACLQAGMNDFLSKPLNQQALEEKLQLWRNGVVMN
ncbi:response regulator [Chitinibacter sp. FCG-7]|uniref:Virulence sensor protein BvgS n=1 Tax=Chitinibacter mangrovi TaxID=3153927 RepID=A0AAU7F6V4_9NEIS